MKIKNPFGNKDKGQDFSDTASPTQLSGVKRLNKIPLYVVGILVLVFVIFVAIAASQKVDRSTNKKENFQNMDSSAHANQILKAIPERGMYESNDSGPEEYYEPELEDGFNSAKENTSAPVNPYEAFDLAIQQERFEAFKNALRSSSSIESNTMPSVNEQQFNPVDLSTPPPVPNNNQVLRNNINKAIQQADDMTEAYKVYDQLLQQLQQGQ